MKVVIFCGGLGVRMGEETQRIPKPMIPIGNRPILWEIMRYYASWGHHEFVLCLGYKGDVIREYFLNYNEALFNDFVLEGHGADARVELLERDLGRWGPSPRRWMLAAARSASNEEPAATPCQGHPAPAARIACGSAVPSVSMLTSHPSASPARSGSQLTTSFMPSG